MDYDIIIIGTGPGGYVASLRAKKTGMKVGVVEKAELGGICLNWGCIPTKSLLKSANVYNTVKKSELFGVNTEGDISINFNKMISRSRKVAETTSKGIGNLFKKNKIDHLKGYGKLKDKNTVIVSNEGEDSKEYTAKNIIIATGSRSRELPFLKQDGKKIIGYREALSLEKQPESMIVVGAGAIGSEFAYFYNAIGSKVTLVEYMPRIVPFEDEEVSEQLQNNFKKSKIQIMTGTTVKEADTSGEKVKLTVEGKKGKETLEADLVLSAVGISPNTENIGLEDLGIETEDGKIKVNDYYQTNIDGVYAIGDIVNGPALAHTASAEGIVCVEKIAGLDPAPIRYDNIPTCIYTSPEVASVGMTEKQAKDAGYDVKIGKYPFSASGRASTSGAREGFVKLVFDKKYGELLGGHFIGENVTEMIAEIVVARNMEVTGNEIFKSVHPHPTMSEAIMEAASEVEDDINSDMMMFA